MRHVRQANLSSGCGPACVAIVSRRSYAAAVRAMFPERRNAFYSFWSDIRRALRVLRVRHGARPRRCSDWERISSTAIVGCGLRAGNFWHWVVYDPKRRVVHDPMRAAPVPLERVRRKPFTYLVIEPPARTRR